MRDRPSEGRHIRLAVLSVRVEEGTPHEIRPARRGECRGHTQELVIVEEQHSQRGKKMIGHRGHREHRVFNELGVSKKYAVAL